MTIAIRNEFLGCHSTLSRNRPLKDDAQKSALKRAEVLRPLLSLQKEGQEIGPAVESAASQLDVSRSTAWRLLGLLRENDGRASALLPNRSGPKLGSLRLS